MKEPAAAPVLRLAEHLAYCPHSTPEDERAALAARELLDAAPALRSTLEGLVKATKDYHQGCECSGSGVVSACHNRFAQGCCGACEVTACECCQDLIVALYNAEEVLK